MPDQTVRSLYPKDEWLTRSEVLRLFKLSSQILREFQKQGLPYYKLSDSKNAKILFKKRDLEDWLKNYLIIETEQEPLHAQG
jgi:hypothetical protein